MKKFFMLTSILFFISGCDVILMALTYRPPFMVPPIVKSDIDERVINKIEDEICPVRKNETRSDNEFIRISQYIFNDQTEYFFKNRKFYDEKNFCTLAKQCINNALVEYIPRGEYPFAAYYLYASNPEDHGYMISSSFISHMIGAIHIEYSSCLLPVLAPGQPVHSDHLRKRFPDGLSLQ